MGFSEVRTCLPEVVAQPVLGTPQPVVDVGEVRKNEPRTVQVSVRNNGAGGKDLRVAAQADTDWVQVRAGNVSVPAGATRTIAVELAPRENVASGDFSAVLVLVSPNAVLEQQRPVVLRGRVVEDVVLQAQPQGLDFGRVSVSDEPIPMFLSVTRSDGEPARVRVVGFRPADGFANSLEVKIRGGSEAEVRLHTANRPPGTYSAAVVLDDEDPDVRQTEVSVTATVVDVPRLHCLGRLTPTVADTRGQVHLDVANDGGAPLVLRAMTDCAWLRTEERRVTIGPGEATQLPLSYDLSAVSGAEPKATLVIYSNDNGVEDSQRSVTVAVNRQWADISLDMVGPTSVRGGRTARLRVLLHNDGDGWADVELTAGQGALVLQKSQVRLAPRSTGVVTAAWRSPVVDRGQDVSVSVRARWDGREQGQAQAIHQLAIRVVPAPSWPGRLLKTVVLLGVLAAAAWAVRAPLADQVNRFIHPEPEQRSDAPIEPAPTPPEPSAPAPQPAPKPGLNAESVKELLQEAWNLKREGHYVEAYEKASKAVALEPGNPEAQWLLGWLACEDAVGEPEVARAAFQEFIVLSPDATRVAEVEAALGRLGDREKSRP